MNVILQSFVVNPLLRAHFLGDNHNSKLCASGIDGEVCVTCEMDKLFQNVKQKEFYLILFNSFKQFVLSFY